jgi:hypothetical protein
MAQRAAHRYHAPATPSITQILTGTPIWVFVLMAYLLWIGASRLKPGVRYFMGWSIRFLMSYRKAPQVDLAAGAAP